MSKALNKYSMAKFTIVVWYKDPGLKGPHFRTRIGVNSAYSGIGKLFPAVDMFLFSVKNQKIVHLCIMK